MYVCWKHWPRQRHRSTVFLAPLTPFGLLVTVSEAALGWANQWPHTNVSGDMYTVVLCVRRMTYTGKAYGAKIWFDSVQPWANCFMVQCCLLPLLVTKCQWHSVNTSQEYLLWLSFVALNIEGVHEGVTFLLALCSTVLNFMQVHEKICLEHNQWWIRHNKST